MELLCALCTNNWRNCENMKAHTIPSDEKIRKEYARLIRNDNLSSSSSTRICGQHFTGGEKVARNQLPTIFPWTKSVTPRREIVKHALAPSSKRTASGEIRTTITRAFGPGEEDTSEEQLQPVNEATVHSSPGNTSAAENAEPNDNNVEEQPTENEFLREEIRLKAELQVIKYKEENEPLFNIDNYQNSDRDISFCTGFPNYETMKVCFNILQPKLCNISYAGSTQDVSLTS